MQIEMKGILETNNIHCLVSHLTKFITIIMKLLFKLFCFQLVIVSHCKFITIIYTALPHFNWFLFYMHECNIFTMKKDKKKQYKQFVRCFWKITWQKSFILNDAIEVSACVFIFFIVFIILYRIPIVAYGEIFEKAIPVC